MEAERNGGLWMLLKGGNGEAQAGKSLISPRHNEIKEHGAIQTHCVPCQLCSSPPTAVTLGFL